MLKYKSLGCPSASFVLKALFFSALRCNLEELHSELQLKNGEIQNLNQAKKDYEWSLGEHCQGLADANSRFDSVVGSHILQAAFS